MPKIVPLLLRLSPKTTEMLITLSEEWQVSRTDVIRLLILREYERTRKL